MPRMWQIISRIVPVMHPYANDHMVEYTHDRVGPVNGKILMKVVLLVMR
jgi:hypothetical protein